jgi:hypothetical protein
MVSHWRGDCDGSRFRNSLKVTLWSQQAGAFSSELGYPTIFEVMDGCPMFAPAYMGRKWFFQMLSQEGQPKLVVRQSSRPAASSRMRIRSAARKS